jgi:hypothetical protein
LSYYWRAVKSALPLPLPIRDSLQSGFWPSSTFGLHWRTSSITMVQCEKNMQRMLHSWRGGVIIHLRHSKLGSMFTLGTFSQCAKRMEICALFGSLKQSRTQILALHTRMLFSFSTGFQHLLNISIQTLMPGGTPKRGMCGMRIDVSFQIGRRPTIS